MPEPATASLVPALRQLLDPALLEQVTRQFGARPVTPQALAAELVRRGWLTEFQAQHWYHGRAGELLVGSYVLLEPLGTGGTGQVYKARHQRMNRLVALKVFRPDLGGDPEAVQRFYREMEVTSQLSHPNIIHAYEAGPIGKALVLVMEYVEGVDLERLVEKSGPLPPALACTYIRQAALGLDYAHQRGLVHRDIKPSNLILASGGCKAPGSEPGALQPLLAGVVKILDLGLARLRYAPCNSRTADLTLASGKGMTQGTPDYMAPEQALDFHGADIRSDLYSLGCTLYYLLAGQPPFAGGALAEKLLKHQQAAPPPLDNYRSDVPPGVVAIVNRLLAKRPGERYQTPGALAKALGDELAKLPAVTASWPTIDATLGSTMHIALDPSAPGRRRRRLWPALGGLCALVLGLVLLLAFRKGPEPPVAAIPPTPPPTPTQPRRPLGPAELVKDIAVSTGKTCTLGTAGLKELCYMDRAYPITELSSGLEGTVLIRTSCNDKHDGNPKYLQFTLTAPATIYLANDPRAKKPPAWVGDGTWQLTAESVGFTVLKKMHVYAKKFAAGRITLGGNNAPSTDATYLLFLRQEL
jgi:serine/threonine protein kinase